MSFPIRSITAFLLWVLISSNAVAAEPATPTMLTQVQAVDEALANSPRIASADASVKAAEGSLTQASASPNPELGIQGENMGGGGQYRGFDSAEITLGVSQQIEIGGKQSAREDAAGKQLTVAKLDAAIMRLDVARDVKQAFAAAVAAQEASRLAEDALSISEKEMKSVSRRVAEAASPLIQKSKAEVTLATAKFNVEQAREEQTLARAQLAVLLGRSTIPETLDAGSFFEIAEPKPVDKEALERIPDMMRLQLVEDRAKALLDIEKASAIPDPTLNLGVRELRETSDRAFMLGFSIPLPVHNSNRGNIAQARAEVTRTASDQQEARLNLLQRYSAANAALRTAYLKATSYNATVLPAAEESFKLSRHGYEAGKFQYLEVLDAQRTLFDSRTQYMAALRDYHSRKAEVERLSTPYTTSEKTDGASDENE